MSVKNLDIFSLGGEIMASRILLGTASYPSRQILSDALALANPAMVTVALRRMDTVKGGNTITDFLGDQYRLLPNTAGCRTAKDAVLTAQMARESLQTNWIKLEVIGDEDTLWPDVEQLLNAARQLVEDKFIVLPYCSDDPLVCRKLADMGCAAVMPLGAPIGSGMGIRNPYNIRMICAMVDVPVMVDAGIGTASDAALAMELGCDGVLINSAIAGAKDPVAMAGAMSQAVISGRQAFLAGRIACRLDARASTPLDGRADWS